MRITQKSKVLFELFRYAKYIGITGNSDRDGHSRYFKGNIQTYERKNT